MPEPQELPEQGEIVVATVSRLMDHGAYVSLDEYGGTQGFLHISEIAPGWIRSVSRFVRPGEKKVLLVKRVNARRSDVDLSLKQVSIDQKKKKLLAVKRYEKGKTLLKGAVERAGLSEAKAARLEEALYARFDSVYQAFSEIARAGKVPDGMGIDGKTAAALLEVSSKIRLPSVEIRGVMEITSPKPDGVEVIREALGSAADRDGVGITYLGAPKYRLSVTAKDFKSAEKQLKPLVDGIQRTIERKRGGGTFKFAREESRKTREG